jgi:hypothetical protein
MFGQSLEAVVATALQHIHANRKLKSQVIGEPIATENPATWIEFSICEITMVARESTLETKVGFVYKFRCTGNSYYQKQR